MLAGCLAACSGPPLVKAPDADPPPTAEERMPEHIGIDVYLDASLSMQGFATAEGSSTTPFAQTLEHFDSSRLLLPGSALDFYRFGAQGVPDHPADAAVTLEFGDNQRRRIEICLTKLRSAPTPPPAFAP